MSEQLHREPEGSRRVLHGAARMWMTIAWVTITALTLGLFLMAIPAEYSAYHKSGLANFKPALDELGLSVIFYAGYRTAMNVIEALLFALTGIFIFWRKSDDWMVALVSVTNITFGALFVPTLVRLMESNPVVVLPVAFIRAVGLFTSLVVFYFLLPDGRFVPRWLRWASVVWGALVLIWLIFPNAPFNLVHLETWFNSVAVSAGLFLLWYGGGAVAQIYRFRRVSTQQQRQQTKWVLYGTIGALIGFLLYHVTLVALPSTSSGIPRLLHILFGVPIYHLLVLLAPVCIALSILSFRLWDIDFLINRSLIYTVLSGALLLFYIACVLLLTQLFRVLTQETQPQIVSIFATLGTAALFSPMRGWVQRGIDSRFYRRKYNANQALDAFSRTVRSEVEVERLRESLLKVIRGTIQPSNVSLWLNKPGKPAEGDLQPVDQHFGFLPSGLSWDDLFPDAGQRSE